MVSIDRFISIFDDLDMALYQLQGHGVLTNACIPHGRLLVNDDLLNLEFFPASAIGYGIRVCFERNSDTYWWDITAEVRRAT